MTEFADEDDLRIEQMKFIRLVKVKIEETIGETIDEPALMKYLPQTHTEQIIIRKIEGVFAEYGPFIRRILKDKEKLHKFVDWMHKAEPLLELFDSN